MELFVLIAGFVLAYLAAKNRGRSAWWWLLGWVGVVFVLVLPSLKTDPEAPHPDTHVRCPECRELVRMDARKCKHCGNGLRPMQ
ncbi:zinc ribbon domain-containing protein [Chromobacterium subtsugae]|uniref:zinc ribbon domain-containing protein n=1 Tax=Chromobacterium subtsugae TaxID=251747 RepID=UPI003CC5DE3F